MYLFPFALAGVMGPVWSIPITWNRRDYMVTKALNLTRNSRAWRRISKFKSLLAAPLSKNAIIGWYSILFVLSGVDPSLKCLLVLLFIGIWGPGHRLTRSSCRRLSVYQSSGALISLTVGCCGGCTTGGIVSGLFASVTDRWSVLSISLRDIPRTV